MQPDRDEDVELDAWRRQWQAQKTPPLDLRRRVDDDLRRMRRGFMASMVVTLVFGGGTMVWAILSSRADVAVLAVATWIFIAVTWVVSLILDEPGGWRPAMATTLDFLNFSIRRRRIGRQTIAAAFALGAPFVGFMLVWKYYELAAEAPLDVWSYLASWRVAIIGAIGAACVSLALKRRRTLDLEIDRLLDLRRQLEQGSLSETKNRR